METPKKRVFICHGRGGTPNSNWQPWLRKELESRGFEVIAPQMPGDQAPKQAKWEEVMAEAIGIPDQNLFFVGHSLGCVSIIRYVEKLPLDVKIGGCVFVGGFYEDIGIPEIKDFVMNDIDFDRVTAHTSNFVTVVSINDDRVPLDKALNLQRKLGAELIEETAGHFRESDGVILLEPALQSVLKMAA